MYVIKHSMKGPVWRCYFNITCKRKQEHIALQTSFLHSKYFCSLTVLQTTWRPSPSNSLSSTYQICMPTTSMDSLKTLRWEGMCGVFLHNYHTPPQALCTVMAFASQRSVPVCKQLPCTLPCVCLHSWGLNTWQCHGNIVILNICLNCPFAGKEWL